MNPAWPRRKLREVARLRTGSPAPQEARYFERGCYPFVRVQDLGRYWRTESLTETKDRINDLAVRELRPAFAKAGSVLFPKSGAAINTNSRAILGCNAYVVSHLAIVEPVPNLTTSEWLYHWFCSIDLGQLARTAALPSLRLSELAEMEIPAPSVPCQQQVIGRLKECMSRVQKMARLREEMIVEADALPSAMLNELWETDEIASAPRISLADLGEITTGNTPSRRVSDYFAETGMPWITPGDMNAAKDITTGREFLSPRGIAEGRARVLAAHSVAVCCIGATIGKVAILRQPTGINQQINAVTFRSRVQPDYGYWACRALYPEILSNAAQATLPILNKSRFGKLTIPVPEKDVQGRIAAKLDGLLDASLKLKAAARDQANEEELLRESILREAFSGKL